MDLLNMTNKAQIHEFYFIRRLNGGNFYLSSHSSKIWWCIRRIEDNEKCKISAAHYLQHFASYAKKHRDIWYQYNISIFSWKKQIHFTMIFFNSVKNFNRNPEINRFFTRNIRFQFPIPPIYNEIRKHC